MALANSSRDVLGMRHRFFRGCNLDESGAEHAVDDLCYFELGQHERFRYFVQIALAVDDGEHFPLTRQQVDEGLRPVIQWREARPYPCVRYAVSHARPFVDAASAFHEERLGTDTHRNVFPHRAGWLFGEGKESLRPRHEIEHDCFDLLTHEPIDVPWGDDSVRDENLSDSTLVT